MIKFTVFNLWVQNLHSFSIYGVSSFNLWVYFRKMKNKEITIEIMSIKKCIIMMYRAFLDYRSKKPSITLIKTASFNLWVQFTKIFMTAQ